MRRLHLITIFTGLCQMFMAVHTERCGSAQSDYGKALQRHIFQTLKVESPLHCLKACDNDIRCQSINHVMGKDICELNNRTKEARPEDLIPDSTKFYMKRTKKRVVLGSIPEVPADSCQEIKASEREQAVTGNYWLNLEGSTYLAYCHMESSGQGWTFIARFSNVYPINWMRDSGEWWYDKRVAVGKTTDPSSNTDMISPAFWQVSGKELKITRSDDPRHTALLQTTSDCLGGQTFRSKIISYGDFTNGKSWENGGCYGNCMAQYGGQYEKTKGFAKAKCNGSIQNANMIGFWCDNGQWDGAVMMIGGGGGKCGSNFYHGIGVTSAKLASFSFGGDRDRSELDFGDSPYSKTLTYAYSLNLWIR